MDKNPTPPTFTSAVVLTGTAQEGTFGPPIGHVDIGVSESAYMFRVALPGVRKEKCGLSCEIERSGKVNLQGVLTSGDLAKKNPGNKYQMSMTQLSPPGPFSLSFKLPGAVDPRLFSATYRSDGILEGIVMKYKATRVPSGQTIAM